MTTRLRLEKVAISGREPAEVTLGSDLTVISGPSDTGKSFVVDVIDFMLGARNLRTIPESEPYSYAALQIRISDHELGEENTITFTRPLRGGRLTVFERSMDEIGDLSDGRDLSGDHSAKNDGNLSNYLLTQLGMAGLLVRKNARNVTRSLSFRDLAHFTVIDETRMQSPSSPVWPSGAFTSRTSDESVFKLLLQGEDDSGLTELAPSSQEKRLSESRNAMLDRVLWTLEQSLQDISSGGIEETREQLNLLSRSVEARSRSVASISDERTQLLDRRRILEKSISDKRSDIAGLQEVYSRLSLLAQQYTSDIERLEMIGETGQLLGMSSGGDCILCGADSEDQHWGTQHSSTSLREAVDAEIAKTRGLATELTSTLEGIRSEARTLNQSIGAARQEVSQLLDTVRQFDASTSPQRDELDELIAAKSRCEKTLNTYEQIANIEALRKEEANQQTITSDVARGLSPDAVEDFCNVIKETLHEWGVAAASTVRYDFTSRDIIVGGKARSTSGKGMRALLHAAFTVSLARYCVDRNLAHPGFVVIDSPLVTYREPDGEGAFMQGFDREYVSERFYSSLARWNTVQFVVMENVDPIDDSKLEWIRMTKNEKFGRYGFFPR
jgi:hypothetical protein